MKIYCMIVSVVKYREIFQVYNNYHSHKRDPSAIYYVCEC